MNQSKDIDNTNERRQSPRVEQNIPLKISHDDFDIVTETKNLSRSGVYCRVKKYIEPMTKLKMHLLLPFKRNERIVTKKVSCQGVVVRTESIPQSDGYNIAIYFNDIQKRDAEQITEFINTMIVQPDGRLS